MAFGASDVAGRPPVRPVSADDADQSQGKARANDETSSF
jgi:hypothetical protein